MGRKKNATVKPGTKVVGIYALLLFSGRAYSLTQLADIFQCSKQTILRDMEQISLRQEIAIETWKDGRQNYYRVKSPRRSPNITLSPEAIQQLVFCRDVVRNMLPPHLYRELEQTVGAAALSLGNGHGEDALRSFTTSRGRGRIDYSRHEETLRTVQRALTRGRLLRLEYRKSINEKPREYCVAPLRLVAYHEALYLRCQCCDADGAKRYDNKLNLAVHRIAKAELLDVAFDDSLKEDEQNGYFGFDFDKPFRVCVRFTPQAATYASERIWGADQKVTRKRDGDVEVSFTATSRPEVVAWVLSFGPEAHLVKPKDLVERLAECYRKGAALYE